MKEVPVKGGELRLVTPVTTAVRTGDGTSVRAKLYAFPLKRTTFRVRVAGMMAHYRVEQTFENSFTSPIEAVYVFPLGDDAAVSSYRIVIGERIIKGEIKTREQARKTYREAKRKGHTAGLLQQEKGNIFSQRIANIAPGETVRVRFEFVEVLKYRDQRYELVLPMVVGPRYLPANRVGRRPIGSHAFGRRKRRGVVSIPYLRPKTRSGHNVDISVRIDAGVPIDYVVSASHHIKVAKVDVTTVDVSLTNKKSIPNRDFILRYRPKCPTTVAGFLTHRTGHNGYFVLMIQPKAKYRTGDIAPREVIILIDQSGSMYGAPIRQAKKVAKGIINTLRSKDTFNVIAFANGVKYMRRWPIRGDRRGKWAGLHWVDRIYAGGGTELERAVLHSLAGRPGGDRIRMVYVLTDGFVGNDNVILAAARKKLGHNRIFPVGVGSAPNRYLLNRLAEVGRGFASYVNLKESPKPYLTEVRIDWGGLQVYDLTPKRIPDVYAGLPLVISGRYSKPGKGVIKVKANAGRRRVTVRLPIKLPAVRNQKPVSYLWARKKIHELMAKNYKAIHHKTKASVTRLGLKFGLVTDFTSYVAVDRSRVVNASGQVRTVVQPAPMPEGVSFATTVGGASSGSGSAYSPPSSSGRSYSYSRRRSSRRRRSGWRRGGGGGGGFGGSGGGGDLDPIVLLFLYALVPLVLALRRRGKKCPPNG
jgi:Ca-activated chloride channel family protein